MGPAFIGGFPPLKIYKNNHTHIISVCLSWTKKSKPSYPRLWLANAIDGVNFLFFILYFAFNF